MRPFTTLLAAALLLVVAGCAARTAPPPPAPQVSAADEVLRIARITRLMELSRQRVALEVELAGLSQRYGENHPEMVRVRRQLAVVDASLTRESASDEARLKQEPESPETQTELALIYMRQGRHEDAERALNRALALLRSRAR